MANMADDLEELDGEEVCTLNELLEQEDELQEASNAVLGASDAKDCSYSKGYVKRQALYACQTCNPSSAPDFEPAGICLACSYKCHDGHDLIELYTKRNFRCDCGNKKLSGKQCVLQVGKDDINSLNSYNQNFKGLYCTCHRQYPDPDDTSDDPMYQCVMCEDWFHGQHSHVDVNDLEDQETCVELICGVCVPKYDFLAYYASHAGLAEKATSQEDSISLKLEGKEHVNGSPVEMQPSTQDSGTASLDEAEINSIGDRNDSGEKCLLDGMKKISVNANEGMLLTAGWRKDLCRCPNCMKTYESLNVAFLLDEDDTFEKYEAQGKANHESEMKKGHEAFNSMLSSLGRVGQIEAIHGFNEMKNALREYLRKFAENGKVVREEDVKEFFSTMEANKRRRTNEYVPNSCR